MKNLKHYRIPVRGLKPGIHNFEFEVNDGFFGHFEASPIEQGHLMVGVQVDKRPDMVLLTFEVSGVVRVECDRCTEPFDMQLEQEQQLVVKYDEDERDDSDVVYISRNRTDLYLAEYLYEYIVLSLPITKTHPEDADGNLTCDPAVLRYLQANDAAAATEAEQEDEATSNPFKDALKDFKPN